MTDQPSSDYSKSDIQTGLAYGKVDIRRRALLAALASATPASGQLVPTEAPPTSSAQYGTASVRAFGAQGDGRTDDTSSFQRAIDDLAKKGGGTLLLPPGVYATKTVRYPYDPVTISTVGAGVGATTWRMASPDRPIIAIDPRSPPKRMTGARFAHFSVQAHAEGRADNPKHIAIDTEGFSNARFQDIRFLSNGKGSVGILFRVASARHGTYKQHFEDLTIYGCIGPGHVIKTENGGDTNTNANLIFIDGFWIYANEDMKVAFDLKGCTTYVVTNGLIESSGEVGIDLGNGGLIQSIWFEDIKQAPFRFSNTSGAAGASNNLLQSLYLSGFDGTIELPVDCVNNTFQNVTGGNFRVVRKDALAGNVLSNSAGFGAKPITTQIVGAKAPLKEVEAVRASGLDGHFQLLYTFVPPAPGSYGYRLEAPPGHRIARLTATAMDGANGIAHPCAIGWPPRDFFVTVANRNMVMIVAQLAYE